VIASANLFECCAAGFNSRVGYVKTNVQVSDHIPETNYREACKKGKDCVCHNPWRPLIGKDLQPIIQPLDGVFHLALPRKLNAAISGERRALAGTLRVERAITVVDPSCICSATPDDVCVGIAVSMSLPMHLQSRSVERTGITYSFYRSSASRVCRSWE
jgi:hypothetical protein